MHCRIGSRSPAWRDAIFDIKDKKGKTYRREPAAASRRVTSVSSSRRKSIASTCRASTSSAWRSPRTVVDPVTGELIAEPPTQAHRRTYRGDREEGKIERLETIYVNDLDRGPFISDTLRIDASRTRLEALVEIYRMMRPGEPPTKKRQRTCSTTSSLPPSATICRRSGA